MATIKAVSSKAGINRALDYVTNEKKTEEHLVSGINCQPETVKDEMQLTKELWGKTEGRTYKHFTQSWHEDEPITPELAHQIGCETAAKISAWSGFEVLIATHTDRSHIHNHFIINSVSFEDGHKLQWSTADLYELRRINDQLCAKHNLHICEKGKSFHGDDRTEPSTYTKEAHHEIQEDKDSYVLAIRDAVADARAKATSREEFSSLLLEHGVGLNWKDSRTYITFTDLARELEGETKCKVRDKKLSQIANQEVSKEALERDFSRNAAEQQKAAAAEKTKSVSADLPHTAEAPPAFVSHHPEPKRKSRSEQLRDAFADIEAAIKQEEVAREAWGQLKKPAFYKRSEMAEYEAAKSAAYENIKAAEAHTKAMKDVLREKGVPFDKYDSIAEIGEKVDRWGREFDLKDQYEAKRKGVDQHIMKAEIEAARQLEPQKKPQHTSQKQQGRER